MTTPNRPRPVGTSSKTPVRRRRASAATPANPVSGSAAGGDSGSGDGGDGNTRVSPLPACATPDARTPPQFVLDFRRPLQVKTLIPQSAGSNLPPLSVVCTGISRYRVDIALDPFFEQTWTLQKQSIGDLASTMGLAPAEKLTLEFQTTQRKVLDQESVDSTESMSSTESTTSDTEAVDITRSSTKTQGWHVDSTGTLTCGYASLSVSAGFSQSVTESNSQAIHHVSNSTQKSAKSLKTLHKIQVKGVTETLVTNRMTRVVVNPYLDRTMTVNVFQLLKHYTVQTAQTEERVALVVPIDDVVFDSKFVISNVDFLQQSLLDSGLIDNLGTAINGAKPQLGEDVLATAAKYARRALHLLFDDIKMFSMPPKANLPDPNFPSNSFKADITGDFSESGLGDSLANDLGLVFSVLNYFYSFFQDTAAAGGGLAIDNDDDLAIAFATTLANDISAKIGVLWPDPTKSPASSDIPHILDNNQYTEIMRRVPGFLALVSGALQPLLDPAKLEKEQQQQLLEAQYVLTQLLQHLECNKNYYIQQFLKYVASTTRNQAIIDLAKEVLGLSPVSGNLPGNLEPGDFDLDRVFIDKQQIVVPTLVTLTDGQIAAIIREAGYKGPAPSLPPPESIDLDVPADGIHLEVAEGACKLQHVPTMPTTVNLSVQGAGLSVSGGEQ